MEAKPKTVIVTGAAQGIGAVVTRALLERGYNVVANSLHFEQGGLAPLKNLALVEGDAAAPSTTAQIGATAISRFGSIDGVVNNAGIFFTKPFIEFTAMEYAKDGIRFNAVAPGAVNTQLHGRDSHEYLKSLSPMGEIPEISDIVDAILYLIEARHVTGEVLHVDAGVHNGKW